MRVLHINCNYMTTVLHQTMMEHLSKTGVHSHVFAPVYDLKRAVITPHDNVTAVECFRKWDRINFFYKQKKIISALEKNINAADFDCIHAYTLFTDGNAAMQLSEKYGIPYVVAIRSTDLNSFFKLKPWLRGWGIRIMEKASAVFFLSERYREEMLNKYVPAEKREAILAKSRIVPNGIDDFWLHNCLEEIPEDRKIRLSGKEIRLIVAGRINRNKNQTMVAKAAEKLREMGYDAKVTVVGNVEEEDVARQLENSPVVTLLPARKKGGLMELYRQQDIFVMPSFQETFGLVYAEAMTQGLPVLYTKGQGFDGQFPEGEVGYSIDPKSEADIVQKILAVRDNYAQISARCPGCAQNFRWDAIVNIYRELYETITG